MDKYDYVINPLYEYVTLRGGAEGRIQTRAESVAWAAVGMMENDKHDAPHSRTGHVCAAQQKIGAKRGISAS